ncbi:hypothetical protein [Flexithrix dorotheae]|uniref:hypothetical protein n=1 Tax=Flexithrix dorotheae TaxID=70993 RepID=UPI000379BA62|nr:hypothetical protein [Flexithrix dorotheae]
MKSPFIFILSLWLTISCKDGNQAPVHTSFDLKFEADTLMIRLLSTDFTDCNKLNSELEQVYQRDQYYRGKLHSGLKLTAQQKDFYRKKMSKNDPYNEKIISYILQEVGWNNSCNLSKKSHEAIWLVIDHSSNLKFKAFSLPFIHSAFKDQLISPEIYAFLIDEIYVRIGRKQQYGMHPVNYPDGRKIYPERISLSIEEINHNRSSIGLSKL